MIRVRFNETKSGQISMSIKGHAGSDDLGKDLVCAASSILAYTMAQNVKNCAELDMLKKNKIMMENGSSSVACTPKKEYYDIVRHSFQVIQTGYHLLAVNYPQYVSLEN